MKPRELRPLVGRIVEVFHQGLRSARVVGVPASDTLTVRLVNGVQCKAKLEYVRAVFWRGKTRSVESYLAMREQQAKDEVDKPDRRAIEREEEHEASKYDETDDDGFTWLGGKKTT